MSKKKKEKIDELAITDIIELLSMYLMVNSEYLVVMEKECSDRLINSRLVDIEDPGEDVDSCYMSITEKGIAYIHKLFKVKLPKQVWK